MSDHTSNPRELAYRACIPFHILWDLDLTANHLRFYGQIEQMENHPSERVHPTFSYQWIANHLGINRRNAINIANLLKKKGYIQRTNTAHNEYTWNTVKKGVLVSQEDTPLVSPHDTLNRKKKNKVYKETTTVKKPSSSSVFTSQNKEKILALKVAADERTDEKFLDACKHHIENNSNQQLSIHQRVAGLIVILNILFGHNEIFKSKGYIDPEEARIKKEEQEKRAKAQAEAQERQHFEKLKRWEEEKKNPTQSKPSQERTGGTRRFSEILKQVGI